MHVLTFTDFSALKDSAANDPHFTPKAQWWGPVLDSEPAKEFDPAVGFNWWKEPAKPEPIETKTADEKPANWLTKLFK